MTEATQPTEQAEATIQEQWVKLHLRIPMTLRNALRRAAYERDVSLNQVAIDELRQCVPNLFAQDAI
jgi:predicted HicB family RNase H-like nuclease